MAASHTQREERIACDSVTFLLSFTRSFLLCNRRRQSAARLRDRSLRKRCSLLKCTHDMYEKSTRA